MGFLILELGFYPILCCAKLIFLMLIPALDRKETAGVGDCPPH